MKAKRRNQRGVTTSTVLLFFIFDALFIMLIGLLSVSFSINYSQTPQGVDTMKPLADAIANGSITEKISAMIQLVSGFFTNPFGGLEFPLELTLFLTFIFLIQGIFIASWVIKTMWSGGD